MYEGEKVAALPLSLQLLRDSFCCAQDKRIYFKRAKEKRKVKKHFYLVFLLLLLLPEAARATRGEQQ